MATVNDVYLDVKYPILRYFVWALYALSVLCVLSAMLGIIGIVNEKEPTMFSAFSYTIVGVQLISALSLAVGGQLVKVLIDIEWNQRENNALLEQLIKNQPEIVKP